MRAKLIGLTLLAGMGTCDAQGAPPSPAPTPGSAGPVVVMPVPTSGATPIQSSAAEASGTSDLKPVLDAIAKATREAVDYQRVTPDLLMQILTKLDKIENKLDKVENAVKAGGRPAAKR